MDKNVVEVVLQNTAVIKYLNVSELKWDFNKIAINFIARTEKKGFCI